MCTLPPLTSSLKCRSPSKRSTSKLNCWVCGCHGDRVMLTTSLFHPFVFPHKWYRDVRKTLRLHWPSKIFLASCNSTILAPMLLFHDAMNPDSAIKTAMYIVTLRRRCGGYCPKVTVTMPFSASAVAFSSSGCPFHIKPTMWTKASRTCQSAALKSGRDLMINDYFEYQWSMWGLAWAGWRGKKKILEAPKAVNCSCSVGSSGSGSVRLNPRIKHQESRSNSIESIKSQESRLKISIVKPGLQNV